MKRNEDAKVSIDVYVATTLKGSQELHYLASKVYFRKLLFGQRGILSRNEEKFG